MMVDAWLNCCLREAQLTFAVICYIYKEEHKKRTNTNDHSFLNLQCYM